MKLAAAQQAIESRPSAPMFSSPWLALFLHLRSNQAPQQRPATD